MLADHTSPHHVSQHIDRLNSRGMDTACNPNCLSPKSNFRAGRKPLANDFYRRCHERQEILDNRRAQRAIDPPRSPIKRQESIRTYRSDASLRSTQSIEGPVDGSGRPMRAKARPLAPGGVPVASLRSGTYDHLSLYGSIKTFNGEKYKTFSHQNILFPTGKTFAKESSTGFSHMENVHEWEKKCLRTFQDGDGGGGGGHRHHPPPRTAPAAAAVGGGSGRLSPVSAALLAGNGAAAASDRMYDYLDRVDQISPAPRQDRGGHQIQGRNDDDTGSVYTADYSMFDQDLHNSAPGYLVRNEGGGGGGQRSRTTSPERGGGGGGWAAAAAGGHGLGGDTQGSLLFSKTYPSGGISGSPLPGKGAVFPFAGSTKRTQQSSRQSSRPKTSQYNTRMSRKVFL